MLRTPRGRPVRQVWQPVGAKIPVTLDGDDRSSPEEMRLPCEFTITGYRFAFKVTKSDETEGKILVDAGGSGVGATILISHHDSCSVSGRIGAVVTTIPVGPYPFDSTFAFGHLWVIELGADRPPLLGFFRPRHGIAAIDPQSNRVVARRLVPEFARRIASGAESLWFTAQYDGTVSRMTPGVAGASSKSAPNRLTSLPADD
jgi:hypothetical protein